MNYIIFITKKQEYGGSVKFNVVEKLIYPNKILVKTDFYNSSFVKPPLREGVPALPAGR